MKRKRENTVIKLEMSNGGYVHFIGGCKPYVWIGTEKDCFGVVPDKDARRFIRLARKLRK